jgi:hypothetical protein
MSRHETNYRFFKWLLIGLTLIQLAACGGGDLTPGYTNPVPPVITSPNSTTFTVGVPGSFTFTASGNPASTFITTDRLPDGVSLNPQTGILSGTPTANSAGVYPLTVKAINGALPSGSQNFTLTVINAATGYSISGAVTLGGSGLSGVTVSTTGGTATTNTSGNYTISGLANGTYTITPTKNGYSFNPTTTSVTVNNANVANKNFTATATP